MLKVLPATLDAERLREELATAQSAAIIKVGRHFGKVRDVLAALDLTATAVVIEKATQSEERVRKLADVIEGDVLPYFTTILVYTGSRAMVKPAIVILGISALPLAQKLKAELGGEIHGPDCVAGRDAPYAKATAASRSNSSSDGRPIIGICASGILIRALAPLLADKRNEPPVVAVAEDGSSVVPLLGGHHGANELARRIAAALRRPCGHHHGERGRASAWLSTSRRQALCSPIRRTCKAFAAALLARRVAFASSGECRGHRPVHRQTVRSMRDDSASPCDDQVRTARAAERQLVYHPQVLAVGVGCERGTDPAEVAKLDRRHACSQ